jgi:hypothetical protein
MTVWMLVLTLGGACVSQDTYPPSGGGGWGSGYGGGGGPQGFGCEQDSDCGGAGSVCARDGECVSPSQLTTIHITWTVQGAAASASTCASVPDLDLTFFDSGQAEFGFSPVPCAEGKFTIDKLPSWFTAAELDRAGNDQGGPSGSFDSSGDLALDLPW